MVISRSKPHIHPVEVMPVLPDSNMWKYPCAQVIISRSTRMWSGCFMIYPQVIFDSDPAPAGVAPNAQMEQMGQAMIRFVSAPNRTNLDI